MELSVVAEHARMQDNDIDCVARCQDPEPRIAMDITQSQGGSVKTKAAIMNKDQGVELSAAWLDLVAREFYK